MMKRKYDAHRNQQLLRLPLTLPLTDTLFPPVPSHLLQGPWVLQFQLQLSVRGTVRRSGLRYGNVTSPCTLIHFPLITHNFAPYRSHLYSYPFLHYLYSSPSTYNKKCCTISPCHLGGSFFGGGVTGYSDPYLAQGKN
jgi:hypothetical protein